jgi:hypothetical protein
MRRRFHDDSWFLTSWFADEQFGCLTSAIMDNRSTAVFIAASTNYSRPESRKVPTGLSEVV